MDGKADSDVLAFVHEDHPVQLTDARIAAQTVVFPTQGPLDPSRLEASIQQSWSFPEARQAVGRSRASVLVNDLMSSSLEHRERLELFQQALLAVLSVVPCNAIHWKPSQRIVDPASFRSASNVEPAQLFFAGAVNVRFYNISDSAEDMVMDTLGLAAIGLPDLQCHFRELEPNDVVPILYNLAWYIFQEGDVIEDGHTVDGVDPGSKWTCQHEEALVAPEREVLDLNPGPPYAAGR